MTSVLTALTAFALVTTVYGTAHVEAQTAPMATVKAAFLFNFTKFTEWPAASLPPGQSLLLCVVGDTAVAHALEETIHGRNVGGHQLSVQVVKADSSPPPPCHLLYVGATELKRSARMLTDLTTSPTLTVSDGDGFAASGGVAQLVLEHERMRFLINPAAAERASLHLSSKLLSLAQIVKDR